MYSGHNLTKKILVKGNNDRNHLMPREMWLFALT